MSDKMIPYDDALAIAKKLSISTLLRYAAQRRDLLQSDHLFQVCAKTDYPGVVVPRRFYSKPEIVLILQHQYRNLTVEPQGFGVDLWFNGSPFRCYIPFDAITVFVDKTRGFAIQQEVRMPAETPPPPIDDGEGVVVSLDSWRRK